MRTYKSQPFSSHKRALEYLQSKQNIDLIKLTKDKWQSKVTGVIYYIDGSNRVVHKYSN